ncbi:hypothetical protein ACRE_037400 [Hapsidospora chrysogenum ATCC 11550]|uniref:Uncharacterized protein n=1 Tax=Hapsidospora chrysogenum (strain ATCC 11550 / CBS 779.69 / DSM 880 / IAM 14645 / JCM 23072 / IMI 49137) TaxID=857340 RepID=A0A086T7V5_HAPC1|nr:hypothetical protein ACRE_037400 [Hapsidospora chrysogenum ATCC 11550]
MPLPPPPRELLAGRVQYEVPLLNRKVDREKDTPTAALYRMYEHLVVDQHIELRNEIEAFWYHSSWLVRDIPDPKGPDPEQYACLACIPKLLCLAFNKRIDLGLPRDAPPIFTQDMLAEWRAQDRAREQAPGWVDAVPKLEHQLSIPHWDNDRREFVPLDPAEDSKVSREFAENVIIWQPHIHFA